MNPPSRNPSAPHLRSVEPGDKDTLLEILEDAFKGLEYLPRARMALSSPYFRPAMSTLAEVDGSVQGFVTLFSLPRKNWFEVRFLAMRDASLRVDLATRLVAETIKHAESQHTSYLKATTLAVQPYVDVYKGVGFKPVRRTLRMTWDLSAAYPPMAGSITPVVVPAERWKDAVNVFAEGLRPYWDWWIDEVGGAEAIPDLFHEPAERECWMCVLDQDKMIGVAWFICNFYGPQEARFQGVYVLPEAREAGIGSALMKETIKRAQQRGQRTMVIDTFSYLDHLAPAVLLYLKSGGRIMTEYLQLLRP